MRVIQSHKTLHTDVSVLKRLLLRQCYRAIIAHAGYTTQGLWQPAESVAKRQVNASIENKSYRTILCLRYSLYEFKIHNLYLTITIPKALQSILMMLSGIVTKGMNFILKMLCKLTFL